MNFDISVFLKNLGQKYVQVEVFKVKSSLTVYLLKILFTVVHVYISFFGLIIY